MKSVIYSSVVFFWGGGGYRKIECNFVIIMTKFLTIDFSLAVNSELFSAELFALYQPELMDAINRGPVLVHCASSKRAGRLGFHSF